ncbi:MAG: DUF4199 domain-containing protein [Prolixibacteraceae bacterium]|jgi:hypothetical protein|nr:DUF4199 domain-containing protein [Prolixibacteraceae bacterium]
MESTKRVFWNKAMLWGFIIAVATIVSSAIFYATDNFLTSSKAWVETAIYVVGIVMCTLAFKQKLSANDEFPYSKALGLGVATAFFASIVLALFTFVLYKYIDTTLVDQQILQIEEQLLNMGLDDSMIEMQMEVQRKLMTPTILSLRTILGSTFSGFIVALITSIFLKKKKSNSFDAAMSEIKE